MSEAVRLLKARLETTNEIRKLARKYGVTLQEIKQVLNSNSLYLKHKIKIEIEDEERKARK